MASAHEIEGMEHIEEQGNRLDPDGLKATFMSRWDFSQIARYCYLCDQCGALLVFWSDGWEPTWYLRLDGEASLD